jgi:hypothetical protein
MNPRSLALGAATLTVATLMAVPAPTLSAVTAPLPTTPLPLGPADLPEARTTRTLQPGLTWTVIERGAVDPDVRWVVELNIPTTASSPDPAAPARSVQDQASAEAFVARLAGQGFEAEAQPVLQTATVDVPAGVIGHRVRLTSTYATKADADAELARMRAAGFSGRSWYAGWDGGSDAAGRWSVHVLTVDPRNFTGELGGTFGPTLETRERTSWLAAHEGATAAVNAGFFVMDPTAGAEGDPAGAAVYDGRLASETIGDRPVLVLDPAARQTRITRPVWSGAAALPSGMATLDGTNRVPGLVRNCGGLGDTPTSHPLHDFTCTDAGELIAFDSSWGATTPSGPGREVVLGPHGRIVRTTEGRGTALTAGQRSLQATGDRVAELDGLRVGTRLPLKLRLHAADDRQLVRPGATVVNGGPQLLADRADHITQAGDGMVHPGNPSFQYGWVLQRNPRTFAGVDAAGRTLFVTVDGRQLGESGLSIQETADVARSLGLVDAINLDGGGSTSMIVEGSLVSHPSDATGERPVGDAIYLR